MEDKNNSDNFNEAEYIQGFNSAFTLKEKKPDLYDLVVKNIKGQSDYMDGLVDGGTEYEAERMKHLYKEQIITQQKNQSRDNGR